MRCMTCGKRIHLGMKECPNCGAMIPLPEPSARPGAGKTAAPQPDWKSVIFPKTASSPPFGGEARPATRPATAAPPEQNREFGFPPAESPDQRPGNFEIDEMAEAEEASESRPAAPSAPAWTRYIVPITIFLWIAFRMFGPELQRFLEEGTWPGRDEENPPAASAVATIKLQQFVLCDSVVEGKPSTFKANFSKAKDRQVVLWTKWLAEKEVPDAERAVEFVWYPPGGEPMSAKTSFAALAAPERGFIAVSELPLGEFSPPGRWRVEAQTSGPNATVVPFVFNVDP